MAEEQKRAKELNASSLDALLSDTSAILFDCDGVIYRGNHLIEGIISIISVVKERDRQRVCSSLVPYLSPSLPSLPLSLSQYLWYAELGVTEALDSLRERKIPFAFVTNNSTRSLKNFASKLHRFGLKWVRAPPSLLFEPVIGRPSALSLPLYSLYPSNG
jgi:hypothetical protein